jgi:WD40 repeat protein/tRNA A-37 threonylcarbamoyl transferase component Bud32
MNQLVRIMGIDDTAPSARDAGEDTLLSAVLRPDVLGGPEQRLQRNEVRAALFGDPVEPVSVGRFRLLERLGEGGMGRVYAAFDEQLDRKIAVKLIHRSSLDSSEAAERTLREARALARVSHPNVVHVYEVGEIDGQLFVAMELLAGLTLRDWLDEQGERDWKTILAVLRQAGEGLAAAHAQGVIHRDFKPQNLMFGADGRVRVLDFGLASFGRGEGQSEERAASEQVELAALPATPITASGALIGTPAYMAPEQLAGQQASIHSDVFGFCVTLYEALYGRRPFADLTLAELRDGVSPDQIADPPGASVPPWLRKVVLRGLSSDPSQRFSSMRALLDALAEDPRRGAGRAWLASDMKEDPAVRRRKWWAAAALIGLVGGGGWGLARALEPQAAGDDERRLAAEAKALRSGELLGEGKGVDALALAIEAASMSSSPVVDAALFEATAAELSWGPIAEFSGFGGQVSFAPDGTRLAVARRKNFRGILYDAIDVHALADGGAPLELRSLGCLITEVAFGADGSTLFARCHDSDDLQVWDTQAGTSASFAGALAPEFSSRALLVATRERHAITLTSVASGSRLVATLAHERAPTMLEFSADGSRVATGGPDQDTRVWDTGSGALTTVLAGSRAVASSFFADGSERVATFDADAQVRIWASESGERLGVLRTLEGVGEVAAADVHALVISPDGARVALYLDRTIWVWNSEAGELLARIEDRAENPLGNGNPWVFSVSGPPLHFSQDGARLATRRHDGSVHLLDSDSGATIARSNLALSYAFSPDGESLAVGTNEVVELWDSASGARIRSLPAEIPHLTEFSPDGRILAAPGVDPEHNWILRLWQTTASPATITRIRESVGRIDDCVGVAVSTDGARIVTIDDVVARVWDAGSGAALGSLDGHVGPITAISTPLSSREGSPLATASVDGSVRVWNLRSGDTRELVGHTKPVRAVEFIHDGTILASGSDDHTVRLWDSTSATSLGEPLEHPGPVTTLKLAADHTRLVTASGKVAYVWDVRERGAQHTLLQTFEHDAELRALAITDRGARIATHDGATIRLWDSVTGELIHAMADPGKVPTLEFSGDGARLIGSAGVWDLSSGQRVVEFEGYDALDHRSGQAICSPVTLSPSGAEVALRGRVWNAATGALLGDVSVGHAERVRAMSFMPEGTRVVTVSRDAVVIRDVEPPLAAACARLRPFGRAYASVAGVCDSALALSSRR